MKSTITEAGVTIDTTDEDRGQTAQGAQIVEQWQCHDADQAAKMLPTFAARTKNLSAGDRSAIQDAANEFLKQIDS